MFWRKQIIALFLALLLLSGLMIPAFAATSVTAFSDVKGSDWFYSSVKYACDKEMTAGTSKTTFSPYATMSRGQFVTILSRMDGNKDSDSFAASGYTDVKSNIYYTQHINWLKANGLTDVTGTTFRPEDPILREEMAIIMGKYIEYKGVTLADDATAPKAFSDIDSVSAAAKPYVEALRKSGMLYGDNSGNCNPKKNMTRAEGVTMFMRLDQKVILAGGGTVANGDGWFQTTQAVYTISLDDKDIGMYDWLTTATKDTIDKKGYFLSIDSISDRDILNTKNGKLVPIKEGTVTMTWLCNTFGSEKIVYVSATVVIAPSATVFAKSISANATDITIEVGESFQLETTISPSNTTERNLNYVCSIRNIASVSSTGLVVGMQPGSMYIQIQTINGVHCNVNVTVTASSKPSWPEDEFYEFPTLDADFFEALNDEFVLLLDAARRENGLTGAQYASHMLDASVLRANEMAQMDELTHTRPNGETSRTAFEGVVDDYQKVTECAYLYSISNYVEITPESLALKVFNGLMSSPPHKSILMKDCGGVVDFSAGVAYNSNQKVMYISCNSYFGN